MKTFIYDDSLPGLFCAFYNALQEDIDTAIFVKASEFSGELFMENKVYIETLENNADALIYRLKTISPYLIYTVILCYFSEISGIENHLYQVISQSIKKEKNILQWLANDNVRIVNETCKKVSKEIHRFKGILRFSQLSDGSYIAKISPDYNIITPLAKYFKERLKSEKWIILDEKRLIAIAYERNKLYELPQNKIENFIFANFAESEIEIRKLWKNFFHSIAIPERLNPKLQKQCLPQRYWKYLPEKF